MDRLTPRQVRRRERTRELLDLAGQIVLEEGVDALTMAGLARRADAGVGALYRYFPSKDDILAALQIRALEDYTDALRAAVEGAGSGLVPVIACFFAWPRFASAHPREWALVEQSLADSRTLLSDAQAEQVNQALQPALALAVSVLADAVAQGLLEPGDDATRAVVAWSAMHGIGHMEKRDRLMPAAQHADPLRRELLTALLLGWGAERGEVERAWQATATGRS